MPPTSAILLLAAALSASAAASGGGIGRARVRAPRPTVVDPSLRNYGNTEIWPLPAYAEDGGCAAACSSQRAPPRAVHLVVL